MPLQATSGAATYDAFGGAAPVANYIEDVFNTWVYSGTGATQTISNGIDLSGKGGLIWTKSRNTGRSHKLVDTARGIGPNGAYAISSNLTNGQQEDLNSITSFLTSGYRLGDDSGGGQAYNTVSENYVSWTFRKQPKFFDVVTYTGNGANRTISHNLGSVPGCIIVKRTDSTGAWAVYHRSLANTEYIVFNTTAAKATGATYWNSTTPTSTEFSLGTATDVNASGGTYVAYLFAHDAGGFGLSGTDNVISCGSFTTDASGNATVNLGYEPQWLTVKASSTAGNWFMRDNMRGWVTETAVGTSAALNANLSNAEALGGGLGLSATGFVAGGLSSSTTYIYIAIRRGPMKVPTDGTAVFSPNISSGATGTAITTNFPVDMQISTVRNSTADKFVVDRLRGVSTLPTDTTAPYLRTNLTSAEASDYYSRGWDNTGFQMPLNLSSASDIFWNFRRAPGFFDEVCYTQTVPGSPYQTQSFTHNLGVAPELVISKCRSTAFTSWVVSAYSALGSNQVMTLSSTAAKSASGTSGGIATPTSTTASAPADGGPGDTYVAYLFASCPGVSKVGSYTGTGATQTISCGFAGGARFVLIKRTDSTGDWYVWDSARGIVAGNDPYLLLNSTAAEVTGTDYVDTYSAGFEISSTAPAGINANGGTFIFLAIA